MASVLDDGDGEQHGGEVLVEGGSPVGSSKALLQQLNAIMVALQEPGWEAMEESNNTILVPVLGALRHSSSQVSLQALECVVELLRTEGRELLGPHQREVLGAATDLLGDSRTSVRDRATEVLVLMAQGLTGLMGVLDVLKHALKNKNTRMRAQAAKFLARAVGIAGARPRELRVVQEQLASLMSDATADVRKAAAEGVERLVAAKGPGTLKELEALGVRSNLLKMVGGAEAEGVTAVGQSENNPNDANVPTRRAARNEKEAVVGEHVEAPVEVVALSVHSDQQLSQELEALACGLQASEDNWQARQEALQKLQQLAVGGAGKYDLFVPQVKAMHELVAAQVSSLRSALSREGCTTISILAQTLADAFAPLAEPWTPVVLRMTQTNILTIAMTADQCLRCMVCCTRNGFPRMLPALVEGCGAKNDTLRLRSLTAMILALGLWEDSSFDKSVDAICRVIKTAVTDKKEAVRAAARQCFWALRRKFPVQSDAIMDALDSSRQKLLYKDQGLVTPQFIEGLIPGKRFCTKNATDGRIHTDQAHDHSLPLPPSSQPDNPRPPPPPMPDSSVPPVLQLQATAPPPYHIHLIEPTNSAAGPPQPSLAPSVRPATSHAARRQSVLPSAMRVAARQQLSTATSPGMNAESSGEHHSGPLRAPMRVFQGSRASLAPGSVVCTAERSGGGCKGDEGTAAGGRTGLSGAVRVVRPQPQQPSTPQSATGGAVRMMRGAEAGVLSDSDGGMAGERGGVPGSATVKDRTVAAVAMQSWDALLREADSQVWSTRVRCFEDTAARLRGPDPTEATQSMPVMNKILSAVMRGVGDAHFRVTQAAMEALLELVAHRPDAVVGHLDQVLPKLLTKLGDSKEQLRTLANTGLDRCREAFDPNALCASLARVLHEQPDRPKVAAMEILRVVIPSSQTYLSHTPATRGLMQKLAAILTGRPLPALQRAAHACVFALYHVDPTCFAEQFIALSSDAQAALRKSLAALVPDLEAKMWGGGGPARQAQTAKARSTPQVTRNRPADKEDHGREVPYEADDPAATLHLGHPSVAQATVQHTAARAHNCPTPEPSDHPQPAAQTESAGPTAARNHDGSPPPPAASVVIQRALMVLGDKMASGINKAFALKELACVLGGADRATWDRYFGQALHILLEGIRTSEAPASARSPFCPLVDNNRQLPSSNTSSPEQEDTTPRDSLPINPRYVCLQGVLYLLKQRPTYFQDYIEVAIGRLLDCAADPYELFHMAERSLRRLVRAQDADRCLKALSSFITDPRLPFSRLLMALRCLKALLPRVSSPALSAVVPSLTHVLVSQMHSREIIMRLAATETLAAIYRVTGDALYPHLKAENGLSKPQLKLLTIYIQKLERGDAVLHAGGVTPAAASGNCADALRCEVRLQHGGFPKTAWAQGL